MIEDDIVGIIKESKGAPLNALVDTFRRGRDVDELLQLLESEDADLVAIAAWILDELPFNLYNRDDFIVRLKRLLDHPDPRVRFNALGALFPKLEGDWVTADALLAKLLKDPNEGVRMSAEAAARRLSQAP